MKPLYLTETPKTFRLSFEYNRNMIDLIKRVPSGPKWDAQEREWVILKESAYYPEGRDARWYVEAFAHWAVQNRFVSTIIRRRELNETTFEIPPMKEFVGVHHMLHAPYPYQLEGVQYALEHRRCIFGDQPGLGKTLQAICTVVKAHKEAQTYGDTFPVLVICPASLKVNWQREFKFFAGINASILDNTNKDHWQRFWELKKPDGEALSPVFIVNYESLKKFFVTGFKNPEKRTCAIPSLTSA